MSTNDLSDSTNEESPQPRQYPKLDMGGLVCKLVTGTTHLKAQWRQVTPINSTPEAPMNTNENPETEKAETPQPPVHVAHDDSDLEDEVLPPQCRIDDPDCEGCQ